MRLPTAWVLGAYFISSLFCFTLAHNGLRKPRMLLAGYWRWGGRGFCLAAEKKLEATRSEKLDAKRAARREAAVP
ncbi:MAG: hypothetical protein Q8L41_16990 [Anaerolineales bacterium]|nr:hypothetical protein [Anaerolineales bacterium]